MKKPLAFDARAGIDLHVHSTASDGTLTPTEIIAAAHRLGLKAIAITDHDTLAGTAAAIAHGTPDSLQLISGIEISAAAPPGFDIPGSVHVLGYGIDVADPQLERLLAVLREARESRNPQIIARLKKIGLDLDETELAPIVGDAIAGRPHIARLLVQKGLADSINDAFDRFLSRHQPGYVEKYRVPMTDAIAAINHAGGVAVLAHPHLNGINEPQPFEAFLQTLCAMGLEGIEAIYPDHDEAATAHYLALAEKYGLLVTGGTDFHGSVTPHLQMGSGRGDFTVPYALFADLARHLEAQP